MSNPPTRPRVRPDSRRVQVRGDSSLRLPLQLPRRRGEAGDPRTRLGKASSTFARQGKAPLIPGHETRPVSRAHGHERGAALTLLTLEAEQERVGGGELLADPEGTRERHSAEVSVPLGHKARRRNRFGGSGRQLRSGTQVGAQKRQRPATSSGLVPQPGSCAFIRAVAYLFLPPRTCSCCSAFLLPLWQCFCDSSSFTLHFPVARSFLLTPPCCHNIFFVFFPISCLVLLSFTFHSLSSSSHPHASFSSSSSLLPSLYYFRLLFFLPFLLPYPPGLPLSILLNFLPPILLNSLHLASHFSLLNHLPPSSLPLSSPFLPPSLPSFSLSSFPPSYLPLHHSCPPPSLPPFPNPFPFPPSTFLDSLSTLLASPPPPLSSLLPPDPQRFPGLS